MSVPKTKLVRIYLGPRNLEDPHDLLIEVRDVYNPDVVEVYATSAPAEIEETPEDPTEKPRVDEHLEAEATSEVSDALEQVAAEAPSEPVADKSRFKKKCAEIRDDLKEGAWKGVKVTVKMAGNEAVRAIVELLSSFGGG